MATAKPPRKERKLSRRTFLKSTGLVVAASSAGLTVAGCAPDAPANSPPAPTPVLTLDDKYLHVPPAPKLPPDPNILLFFTPSEARVVEAATARIIPGDESDPGAREAGVVIFIDRMLAGTEGYAEPAYTQPPFARFYSGDAPPPEAATTDPAQVIWVPEAWKEHFGWQAGAPPQELYRAGIRALNTLAGGNFADLSEAEQDALLEEISGTGMTDVEPGGAGGVPAEDNAEPTAPTPFDDLGIPGFSGKAFFDLLKLHTVHGMFGDPLYGGNRFLVGWQLVGYPGARRAYTEQDLVNEAIILEPQSLAHLPPFHPGRATGEGVINPMANGDVIEQTETERQAELRLFCEVRK